VLLPELRGHPERLGKLLAYARFVYIALHREVFRDEVVSELMPPLEPDGTSLLWEALGRHFTGLSYQEADRLSRENKEFIRSLFPQDPIYATLLPERAQALIGQVGPTTKPVERMLLRVGFEYAHRIDPFDGGPHFHARTDQIGLVKGTRRAAVRIGAGETDALVAAEVDDAPWFRAVRARVALAGDAVAVPAAALEALAVNAGASVAVTPLPEGA
jgi:arginine N-succinyltransferase